MSRHACLLAWFSTGFMLRVFHVSNTSEILTQMETGHHDANCFYTNYLHKADKSVRSLQMFELQV